MKITREHRDHMKSAILKTLSDSGHNFASILKMYNEKGLSHMRLRWDVAYRAGLPPWICANIYPYANDNHVDTALRSIFGHAA